MEREGPQGERQRVNEDIAAQRETSVGDVAGSPTWPMPQTDAQPPAPPVGLNWTTVAEALDVDRTLLEHEGLIVAAGEYFPESGYFLSPESLEAQRVDVGDMALQHGYFLGRLSVREFASRLTLVEPRRTQGLPVMRSTQGPVIGLFATDLQAKRARTAILQGAMGAGVRTEEGPLGVEVRIERPELAGRVASLIAGHGGAVISLGGAPVSSAGRSGMMSTASGAGGADAFRPGTGVTGDSQAPPAELGGSEEFRAL